MRPIIQPTFNTVRTKEIAPPALTVQQDRQTVSHDVNENEQIDDNSHEMNSENLSNDELNDSSNHAQELDFQYEDQTESENSFNGSEVEESGDANQQPNVENVSSNDLSEAVNDANDISNENVPHNVSVNVSDDQHNMQLNNENLSNITSSNQFNSGESTAETGIVVATNSSGMPTETPSTSASIKNTFQPLIINEVDVEAMGTVFNLDDSNGLIAPNELSTVIPLLAQNEKAKLNECNQIEVTRTLSSDCEFSYIWGESLMPKQSVYEVKLNDIISDNIPFRQDVSIYLRFFFSM